MPRSKTRPLIIGALAVAMLGGATFWALRMTHHHRNVVVICMDTVRYDTFYLRERVDIPDSLSPWLMRGGRFSDAQSAAPWTIPSVATVLTGLYPPHHGAGRFPAEIANLDTSLPSALAQGVPTLAEELRRNGYTTIAFYDNPIIDDVQRVLRGFQEVQRTNTRAIPKAGREWLAAHGKEKPFFLYLHLMDAHNDHMMVDAKLKENASGVPANLTAAVAASAPAKICSRPPATACVQYYAYTSAIDRERAGVATVLAELQRENLLADTIVVLFSDHGEEFHDHRRIERNLGGDPRDLYGMGHGHSLYQELLHVPLVIWLPGLDGKTIDAPVSLVDVAPTIAQWLHIDLGRPPDGTGLTNVLDVGKQRMLQNRIRYSTGIAYGAEQFAAVLQGAKRIDRTLPRTVDTFDLRIDPGEHRPQLPGRREALGAALVEFAALQPLGATNVPALTSERLAALKSIGYLSGAAAGTTSATPTSATVATRFWTDPARCNAKGFGVVDIHWSAPAADEVQIRLFSPTGTTWMAGPPMGHAKTGPWLGDEAEVYLMDASDDLPTPQQLAKLTFHCSGPY